MIAVGAAAFLGFKVWEIFDGWYGPYRQNKKYEQIKKQSSSIEIQPLFSVSNSGGLAGVKLTF